ncbi:related to Dual specificity protein kinase KNS1 [Zygosaccharomyces bailii ISA1307]|nr:related to Dual specificity protein kinase KNS1 [Zygosaccharomyces bailii ISA1307]
MSSHIGKKRSRNPTNMESLMQGMLAKQDSFLNNNLTGGGIYEQPFIDNENLQPLEDNDNDISNAVEDDDDDVIFIKEQPVYLASPAVPASDNYTSTTSKKFKKQRTISLPQLPHAKLLYQGRREARGQNNDELLHLTGSSSRTLDGNRALSLRVVYSASPDDISERIYSSVSPPGSSTASASSDSASSKEGMATATGASLNGSNPHKRSLRRLSAPRLAARLVGKKPRTKKRENFKTDKDGHYIYRQDDVFGGGRFLVKGLLGQGTFGKVLKCSDSGDSATSNPFKLNSNMVAVKVIRAIDRYREAAKTELRVLQAIRENDITGQYQCLMLQECFEYRHHVCIVTDLLGKSVYDFMCSNGVARFPGSHVQAMAKQLIRSVCFLHDLGIIHTDLKPENVVLCDESYVEKDLPPSVVRGLSTRRREASGGRRKLLKNPEIKVIDFGSAVFHKEYHPPVISTRHYRAPEIVLGLGWSFPCDVWSIACVLVELVTGESLYPTHENLEHMAMMQRVNGEPFPPKIVGKMFYKSSHNLGNLPSDLNSTVVKHFDKKTLSLQWPEKNKRGDYLTKDKSIRRVMDNCDRLDFLITSKVKADYGDWLSIDWNISPEKNWALIKSRILGERKTSGTTAGDLNKETFLFWYWFIDLCRKMFEFDPTKRITAREALDHKWFNLGILDEGITSFGEL